MTPVNVISGTAVPYPASNVDTDEIIPARFLFRDRKDGFADTLFRDLRFDAAGNARPEFVLNLPRYANPRILVSGHNFGCGSSREHAVWALLDSGIACVIANSFGDIFRNNAVQNRLLPVTLADDEVGGLLAGLQECDSPDVTVELEAQRVVGPDGTAIRFDIDSNVKQSLLSGLTKIEETLLRRAEIDSFEQRYWENRPWAMPRRPTGA